MSAPTPISLRPGALRALFVFGLLSIHAACGGGLPPLEAVAHPDLAGAEEGVRKQLGDARDKLESAISAGDPLKAAAAFGNLGELYLAYDYNTPAAASLRNAEKLDPASFVWPYEQGLAARAAGDPAARGHFERALQKNPGYPAAQAHLEEKPLGSFADPLRERIAGLVRSARAVAERDGEAQRQQGAAFLARNQYPEAASAFRRAIELHPGDAEAQLGLATSLVALQRWDEAGPAVEKAAALAPADPRVSSLRAAVLGAAGKTTEAIELYRGAAKAVPTAKEDAVRMLDEAAKLAWRKNQRDQAILLWRQAVEKDPLSSAAHLNLGNGLQLSNRREEAKTELAKAVELDPADANARLSLDALRILMGDFAAARQSLEEGLALKPDQPALMNNLARLLATCPEASVRDGKKAFALAQKAFALEARLEHAETVGMALAEMGQFEQAIRWQRDLAQQAQQRNDRAALTRLVATLQTYQKRLPIRATLTR
jgi:tetratricopeptide (TPR) repeat protein